MNIIESAKFRVRRFIGLNLKKRRRAQLKRLPNVVHIGGRAFCDRVEVGGRSYLRKTFDSKHLGASCYEKELLAHELFRERPWMPPFVRDGKHSFLRPWYAEEARLDAAAAGMDEQTRFAVARQAVGILFDIFAAGYAHRDFHAGNLFWVNGQLLATDFETLERYPAGRRPPFPLSYDLVGKGLDSPFDTGGMCYTTHAGVPSAKALQQLLGVPLGRVLDGMVGDFKRELLEASLTFKSNGRRHQCGAQRIYNSVALPYVTVPPEQAQRDCARRFERFGIAPGDLAAKRILDLGSNVGGMLFEAQAHRPGRCVGVEYDPEKVRVAARLAAYNGLNNVEFVRGDIDELNVGAIGGPFDAVFCLAVESHVKKKQRLYKLLAEAAREVVYFEGNSATDATAVRAQLLKSGFRGVEFLGFCDDDCLPANHNRPLLVARK